MQTVSKNFLAAVQGSTNPVFTADLWKDGQFVQSLTLESGSVTFDANQNVQATCSLVVLDKDGTLTPTSMGDNLTPFGAQINIKAGIELPGGAVETVSLGWYLIWDIEVEEAWSSYTRNGATTLVRKGSRITVNGRDLMQKIADFKFLVPTQPTQATAWAEIVYLIQDVVPTLTPSWIPTVGADLAIPATMAYGEDRLEAIKALAAIFQAEPVMTSGGRLTLRKLNPTQDATNTAPTFGWNINLTQYKKTLSRDGVFNIVVTRGKSSAGNSIIAYAIQDTGPTSFYGSMGPRPVFYDSEVLQTTQALTDYANAQLATTASQNTQTVPITALPNPAIELGDYANLSVQGNNGLTTSVTCRIIGFTYNAEGEMDVTLAMPKNWIA
jgi:hypothetical protein